MANKAKASAPQGKGSLEPENWSERWGSMLQANRATLDYWATVSGSMMRGLFEMSQQMVQFAQVRLGEDVKVYETLCHCKDPGEALDCQKRFAEKATAQYLEQVNALNGLMTQISTESLSSMQRAMAAGERSVAGKAQ